MNKIVKAASSLFHRAGSVHAIGFCALVVLVLRSSTWLFFQSLTKGPLIRDKKYMPRK